MSFAHMHTHIKTKNETHFMYINVEYEIVTHKKMFACENMVAKKKR
jgi:hypothetical protein